MLDIYFLLNISCLIIKVWIVKIRLCDLYWKKKYCILLIKLIFLEIRR